MSDSYNEVYKAVGPRLNSEQRAVLQELAHKAGMTLRQYIRDVVYREHVERLGIKWPEDYIGGGSVTGHGGKGRGGGRKRIPPKE